MKTIPFYKKKKWYVLLAILLGAGGLYAYFSQEAPATYETITAERGELIQEVSVTGRVKAVESADLAFETSGRVAEIFVKIGEDVEAGQELISLNNDSLKALKRQAQAGVASAQAQLQQYEASLESQQAKLDELKRGTRPEEIQLAETALYNAEKNLEDTNINLKNIQASADAALEEAYSSALNALPTAVNAGKSALLTLTDIQYAHFTGSSTEEISLANAKKIAVDALLGAYEAGRWTTKSISVLSGGVYGEVQNVMLNPSHEAVDTVLTNSLDALLKVKNALDAVPVATQLTATEKTSLDTEKSAIDLQASTISGKRQAIIVQKAANNSSVSSAEAAVNNAKNALATAQDQLDLKRAGYTQDQINAQEAQVKQAKAMVNSQRAAISQAWASVQNYQAQIDKTILKAPISGTVSRLEVKVGEIVFPSSSTYEIQVPAVSIISKGDYEIEVSVPEVDVTKVKIGDSATVTLDAYGSDDIFLAEVSTIDPAETLVEGLATYKTTLVFTESYERVRSGMTANVDIRTASKADVIAIPQRLVITKDGKKIVRVLKTIKDPDDPEKTIEEVVNVNVKTGIRGSAGEIEITEGISDGDRLITAIHNGD